MTVQITLTFTLLMLHVTSLNVNGLRTKAKIDSVLTTLKVDILCLQETWWDQDSLHYATKCWDGPIYSNFGSDKSCGVAILFKENTVANINEIYKDDQGRVLIIDFSTNSEEYRIINVYAANSEGDRKLFFISLKRWVCKNVMITGDFNVALTKCDVSINNTFKNDCSRTALRNLIDEHNLVEVWRVLNPAERAFSRRQVVMGVMRQSRVDLCLASSGAVKTMNNLRYVFNKWSDHAYLCWQLGYARGAKGGGTWCFNTSLLEDSSFREKIKKLLCNITEELDVEENHIERWDGIKKRVKRSCINYSKRKRWVEDTEERSLRDLLSKELFLLDQHPKRNCEKYEMYKAKLDDIEQKRCRGAAIRSRVKNILEGEKCTAFFLGLEKKKQNKAVFAQLKNNAGEVTTEQEGILDIVHTFYEKLFTNDTCNEQHSQDILRCVEKQLVPEDREWCDGPISIEEVEMAITTLNKNKSPGEDGLSAEFYLAFKDQLAPLLFKLYNSIELSQLTPKSLTKGIITLVFKNKGDKDKLENYRPISLLNTDYKILTKILANRIKTVIGSIVGPTQAYSIPGRDIADTIGTIRDTVRIMSAQGGILLGVDLEKAFDKVEHPFLWMTLEKFGFGPKIIRWIRLLYKNAYSCVKCNGLLTKDFQLRRSVRQGCPLSSLLYSLVVEPLALKIQQDKNIKGVFTSMGTEIRIMQYADDINIMVSSEDSIDKVLQHLKTYETASGAKINKSKSEIMFCGRNTGEVNKMGIYRNRRF